MLYIYECVCCDLKPAWACRSNETFCRFGTAAAAHLFKVQSCAQYDNSNNVYS